MNSISESLYHGVPMVVIPFMVDQPTNARRIEELHLGKRLDYKKVSKENIRDTVFSVLEDETIHKCVLDFQAKLQSCRGNEFGVKAIEDYYATFG